MKVVQLIGSLKPAGAETVAVELANALAAGGMECVMCAREGGALEGRLQGVRSRIVRKRMTYDPGYVVRLAGVLRTEAPDVIHAHLFGNNVFGFAVGRLLRIPVIMTLHGHETFRSRKRIWSYRVAGPRAGAVVAVSDSLAEQYRKLVGDAGNVRVIMNGIDIGRYRERIDPETREKLYGWPRDAFVFASIGNVKWVKGYDVLVEAFGRLQREYPHARLAVVGHFDERDEYARELAGRIRTAGLDGSVRLLGRRLDIPRILAAADAYVLSSRSEGTSMALLEALAAGKPVVATRAGGTPGILSHGETGLLVEPGDPECLHGGLRSLIADAALRRRLAEAGRGVAQRRYSLTAMVDAYCRLYEDVGGGAPGRGH